MPIYNKSIGQQISNPRETYIDGYGTQREVSEPAIITFGRRAYDKIDGFLNGPETINIDGQEVPIQQGAGLLEVLIDPAGVIGKVDDVAKLVKNLDSVKDRWDGLRRFQLRRKVNKAPGAQKALERNAREKATKIWNDRVSEYIPFDEEEFLSDIRDIMSYRINGNPLVQRNLELDKSLNPLAKQYNDAIKLGKTQEASKIKQKMGEIVDDYDAPGGNGSYYDVNTRIFNTKNGGTDLTPKERQTLLLDIENPG